MFKQIFKDILKSEHESNYHQGCFRQSFNERITIYLTDYKIRHNTAFLKDFFCKRFTKLWIGSVAASLTGLISLTLSSSDVWIRLYLCAYSNGGGIIDYETSSSFIMIFVVPFFSKICLILDIIWGLKLNNLMYV